MTRDVTIGEGWNFFKMSVTSKVRFGHNNGTHAVELSATALATKRSTLTVSSDPIVVNLEEGAIKGVDSDGNKYEDLDVKIQSVESDSVAMVGIKSKEEQIPPQPVCGDKKCNGEETCNTCPGDCGVCPVVPVCGDKKCNGAETCNSCPGDCGVCPPPVSCGDSKCNGDENCESCAQDCGVCPAVPVCGNQKCDGGETCNTCAQDCGICQPQKPDEGGIKHACSDNLDNDGDGKIDMDDPGCINLKDDDETDIVLDEEEKAEQEQAKAEDKVNKELDSETGTKVVNAISSIVSGLTKTDFAEVRKEVKAVLSQTLLSTVDNPVAEKVNEIVQSPVTLATTAASVASVATVGATGAASASLLTYLQFLFTQPIMLLTRRRRQNWGIVYNSITKKPLDLAVVRVFEVGTNRLVTTRVTDRNGRYQFIVKPGQYFIEVNKKEHKFPSEVIPQLIGQHNLANGQEQISENIVDGEYQNLYNGGTIVVGEAGIINRSIPVDPDKKLETDREIFKRLMWKRVQTLSTLIGPIIAVISYIINPQGWVAALVVIQVIIYFIFRRLSKVHKPLTWGSVKDLFTGRTLKRTVVRVFDTRFNKLLDTQVTDNNGKYGFLVSKGEYYLTGNRDNYEPYKSEFIDLTGKDSAYIAEEIKMKQVGNDIPLAPSAAEPVSIAPEKVEDIQPDVTSEIAQPEKIETPAQPEIVKVEEIAEPTPTQEPTPIPPKTDNIAQQGLVVNRINGGNISQLKHQLNNFDLLPDEPVEKVGEPKERQYDVDVLGK